MSARQWQLKPVHRDAAVSDNQPDAGCHRGVVPVANSARERAHESHRQAVLQTKQFTVSG